MVSRKKQDPTEELRKIINSKHKRTGKPENWTPEQMKVNLGQKRTIISLRAQLRGKLVPLV